MPGAREGHRQAYLIGDIDHQVITLVAITILKQETVEGCKRKPGPAPFTHPSILLPQPFIFQTGNGKIPWLEFRALLDESDWWLPPTG